MALSAITMPKWGVMSEGVVAEWFVRAGEDIKSGMALLSIETGKTTNEMEAQSDGRIMSIVANVGDELPVGALLGVLGNGDESDAAVRAFIDTFESE